MLGEAMDNYSKLAAFVARGSKMKIFDDWSLRCAEFCCTCKHS